MKIEKTKLTGVKLLKSIRFDDHRGFFSEIYSRRSYQDIGLDDEFVQDNHSLSTKAGTVRGLHFQLPPMAQVKLVRCGRGAIFDIAVDIRRGSPTYGSWVGYELSAENGAQLYIPEGFAHGYITLKPYSEIIYKCSNYYAPRAEGSVRWNDPKININWPLTGNAILSDKDAIAPLLANLNSPFEFGR